MGIWFKESRKKFVVNNTKIELNSTVGNIYNKGHITKLNVKSIDFNEMTMLSTGSKIV